MRVRRTDQGAAAVEMALVLPFLLLLVCGIIDFGRAYNAQITLASTARESIRVFALGGTRADVSARASQSAGGLAVTAEVIYPATPTASCTFGDRTTVRVTTNFTYLTPLIHSMAPSLTTLSSEGVMRCGG